MRPIQGSTQRCCESRAQRYCSDGRISGMRLVLFALALLSAVAAAQTHEVYPSLAAAPDGNGFIATWLEVDPSNPMTARAVFSRLDAALTPSAPTTLYPPLLQNAPTVARTKNGKSWISAGGF